jgi:hypothetical protein
MSAPPRVYLVCPEADRERASRDAAKLSGRPQDATPRFFSVPLSDGERITHYLASTPIREESLAALPYLAAQYPGAAWVLRSDAPDLDAWLARLGLARMEEKDD